MTATEGNWELAGYQEKAERMENDTPWSAGPARGPITHQLRVRVPPSEAQTSMTRYAVHPDFAPNREQEALGGALQSFRGNGARGGAHGPALAKVEQS